MKILKVYTDGRYIPRLKSGATSFIVLEVLPEENKLLTESAKFYQMKISDKVTYYNTNHKMEIQAVINSLNWLRSNGYNKSHRVYVYTDSQNIQLAVDDWMAKWKQRDWMTSAGTMVKNKEMWEKLDVMSDEFESLFINWVQGHNGDKWNERADELCRVVMEDKLGHECNVKI
jgi:ribonuclease HI